MRDVTVTDLGGEVFQVTHPLPWVLNHVHCYAIADPDGWTIVDAGLGDTRATARWKQALAELGNPRVARLIITHHHPDHCGGGTALAALVEPLEIVQGALDADITDATWRRAHEEEDARYFIEHGMPADLVERVVAESPASMVHPATPTRRVVDGDIVELAGEPFRVLHLPGHADGHIALLGDRSGRMFGGDVLLDQITPNIPRWPLSLPDPLGSFLTTLEQVFELDPKTVLPGHRRAITDARGRIAEIRGHHAVRLDATAEALRMGARTGYDVSLHIWGDELATNEKRFALLEALSHLERLEVTGRARRVDGFWAPA